MSQISPISLVATFSEMGNSSPLLENGPGGSQVILGYSPPVPVGTVEDFDDITHFKVTQCSYGSIGSAEIETAIVDQPFTDFLKSCRRQLIGVDVWITADGDPSPENDLVIKTKAFSGFVDTTNYHFDRDHLVISCRDRASLLMEDDCQARQFDQMVIWQVVAQLANDAGLDHDTNNLPSLIVQDANTSLQVGAFLRKSKGGALSTHRSSAWEFIQKMADAIGYVAFATPTGQLYFGPRVQAGLSALTFPFGGSGFNGDIRELELDHTPARNGAFHVQVSSHDPTTGATLQGTATYVNPEMAAFDGATVFNNGIVTGLAYGQVRDLVGEIQIYNFFADGLTSKALQLKAIAHAMDIQAHELVLKCTIDGANNLQVGQQVRITGTNNATVDSTTFVATGVTQEIHVPQKDQADGFQTHLAAWSTIGGA